MRVLPLLLVAATLVLSGSAWGQQDSGQTQFTLLAELRDGEYVWVREGETNPTLQVPPHANVTVFIQQGETAGEVPHDLQVGGGGTSDRISGPGDSAELTFTAPPSGTLQYVCTVHPSTMRGEIEVVEDGAQESTDNGVPLAPPMLVAAVAALAALAWRRRGT